MRLADTLGFAVDAERWERILHPLLRTGTTEFIDLLRRHLQELCGFFNRQHLVVIHKVSIPAAGTRTASGQAQRCPNILFEIDVLGGLVSLGRFVYLVYFLTVE